MTVYAWNTCRGYTAYGQRIAAVQLSGTTVAFVDVDRNVDGTFQLTYDQLLTDRVLKRVVMGRYDHGNYTEGVPQIWPELYQRLAAAAVTVPGVAEYPVPEKAEVLTFE